MSGQQVVHLYSFDVTDDECRSVVGIVATYCGRIVEDEKTASSVWPERVTCKACLRAYHAEARREWGPPDLEDCETV